METIYGWGDEGAGSMLTILINTVVQIFDRPAGADKGSSNLDEPSERSQLTICFVVLMFCALNIDGLPWTKGQS